MSVLVGKDFTLYKYLAAMCTLNFWYLVHEVILYDEGPTITQNQPSFRQNLHFRISCHYRYFGSAILVQTDALIYVVVEYHLTFLNGNHFQSLIKKINKGRTYQQHSYLMPAYFGLLKGSTCRAKPCLYDCTST